MPTYDYECRSCGYTYEAFQKITADPLKTCPRCGKKVKRLVGGGMGIIFKGSGFYSTDNKSPASNLSSGNGSSKKSESSEGDKSTETKSETSKKTDSKSN